MNLIINLINNKKTIVKENRLIFIHNVYNLSLRFYLLTDNSFIIKIIKLFLLFLTLYYNIKKVL